MLKRYKVGGRIFQFNEGEQPIDAVEIVKAPAAAEPAEPKEKAVKPANKARTVKRK